MKLHVKDRNGNYELKDVSDDLILSRYVPPDQMKLRRLPNGDSSEEVANNNNVFVVEKILDHKFENGDLFYLVKWKGESNAQNTWEPQDNFIDTQCIRNYWKHLNKKD